MTRFIEPCRTDNTYILRDESGEQISSLAPDDVIVFCDWYDARWVNMWVREFGKPMMTVSDVEGSLLSQTSVPHHYIPYYGMSMKKWIEETRDMVFDDDHDISHCFNFAINKKRPDRYVTIKIMEWFNLESMLYTWSGAGRVFNAFNLFAEFTEITAIWFTDEFRDFLLQPIKNIKEQWYLQGEDLGITGDGRRNWQGDLKLFWHACKQKQICSTAVSIVNESSHFMSPNFVFGEKTLLPIMGLTFPIWAGNYGSAQQMQCMGLDVFDDVINHDYQYKKTVTERCYHAIADNLDILRNLDHARDQKIKHHARLLKNRDYIMRGGFDCWLENEIKKLPEHVANFVLHKAPRAW